MIRWIPAAAIATFVLGAQAAYAQAPAKDLRSNRSGFPAGSHRGPGARRWQCARRRRDGFGGRPDDGGGYDRSRGPVHAARASVRPLHPQRALARLLQVARAHGSAHDSKVSIPEIQLHLARANKAPAVNAEPVAEATAGQATQLAGFGLESSQPAPARVSETTAGTRSEPAAAGEESVEVDETAWRMRHLPRSILKDVSTDAVWAASGEQDPRWFSRPSAAALAPIAFFSELPLSGQVNLMTIESFDSPGEIFAEQCSAQRGIRVGQHAGRRRRLGDAGRDDAGGPVVVDRRRLLQVDRVGEPRLRAGAVLQHAALRRRQCGGARRDSRERAQRRQRLWIRRVDGVTAPRAWLRHRLRPLRLPRRPRRVEPAVQRHRAARRDSG